VKRPLKLSREALAAQQKADKLRQAQVETALRGDDEMRAKVEEVREWFPAAVVVMARKGWSE
jgi:hypothetical protein